MKHLFVSDVHLGAFSPKINQVIESDLTALIDYCQDQEIQIHILGDLFDYWMEYPGYIPELGKTLLDRFESYNTSFQQTTYITGNHDNWTLGHFAEKGFEVAVDFVDLNIGPHKVLMHHGDGFSNVEFDLPRPFFHRLLRHKWFISLFQFIFPARTGLYIMKSFSALTRTRNYINPHRLSKWSEQFLENSDFDFVLCGHDHIPRVETFSYGTYINLGTFFRHRSMAAYTNGQFRLVIWNSEKKELQTVNSDYQESSFI